MDARADDDREWEIRWSLGSLHFLVIAAFTWARIVRDGALLSRVPVEWVPWLTVAVLVATGLADAAARTRHAAAALRRARSPAWPSRPASRCSAGNCCCGPGATWSAMALYVWVGAYGPLLVAQFWLLVHQSLDAEQARRAHRLDGRMRHSRRHRVRAGGDGR